MPQGSSAVRPTNGLIYYTDFKCLIYFNLIMNHNGDVCNRNISKCVLPQPALHSFRGADKSLARPTSRCILFDGENISFDASLVIYINSTNIPPIMIINRIPEYQNLLSL